MGLAEPRKKSPLQGGLCSNHSTWCLRNTENLACLLGPQRQSPTACLWRLYSGRAERPSGLQGFSRKPWGISRSPLHTWLQGLGSTFRDYTRDYRKGANGRQGASGFSCSVYKQPSRRGGGPEAKQVQRDFQCTAQQMGGGAGAGCWGTTWVLIPCLQMLFPTS